MRFDARAATLCALMLAAAPAVLAQSASAIKRTEIYKGPVAAADHEAVLMKIELAPGGHAPRHNHPGDEVSYVTDGEKVIRPHQPRAPPPSRARPGRRASH